MSYQNKTEILYLSSNPSITVKNVPKAAFGELGLNYEATHINSALEASRYGNEFRFDAFYDVRFSDIEKYIEKFHPDILHLAFHYKKEEKKKEKPEEKADEKKDERKLVMTGANGGIEYVDPDSLIQLLKKSADCVKLLVLRIFESNKLADEIYQNTGIKAVISLSSKKNPLICHEFMSCFYQLLGNGMNLGKAYDLARDISYVRQCGFKLDKDYSKTTFVNAPEASDCFALLLASTPVNVDKLNNLAAELDSVTEMNHAGTIKALYPSSQREILMAVAYYQPRVILFSSHGSMEFISYYNEKQERVKIDKEWLFDLTKEFRDVIECIVFSSCENMAISFAVSKNIPYVIGTTKPVFDDIASVVTKNFFYRLRSMGGELDYKEAYEYAIQTAKDSMKDDKSGLDNLEIYRLFEQKDYERLYKKRWAELLSITQNKVIENYGDEKFNPYVQEFKKNYPDWAGQMKNRNMTELTASMLRYSVYVSFSATCKFYINQYHQMREQTDSNRIAYLPLKADYSDFSTKHWLLFKYLTSADPDRTWLTINEGMRKIDDVFHLVLITDFLSTADDFKKLYMKFQGIFKKKRITIVALCTMYHTYEEILKFAEEKELDVRIRYHQRLEQAFTLYPEHGGYKRHYEYYCKRLDMPKEKMLGKNQAEALCIFYDRVPEETLGLFSFEKIKDDKCKKDQIPEEKPSIVSKKKKPDNKIESFKPLFTNPKPVTADTSYGCEVTAKTEEEIRAQIKTYLEKHNTGFTMDDLSRELRMSLPELRKTMDRMVRSRSKRFKTKTEMREAMNMILNTVTNYIGDIGEMNEEYL